MTDRAFKKNVNSLAGAGLPAALEPLGLALEGTDPLTQFAKEEMDPLSKTTLDSVRRG